MSEESIYWLAKPGTKAHEHCEEASDEVEAQYEAWRKAFVKLAALVGFDKDRPFFFMVNGAGMTSDSTPRPVDNVAIFLPSGRLRTVQESNKELLAIGELFERHGVASKVARSRDYDNGAPHLKLVLRKKAEKQWLSEKIGPLPAQQDLRRVLARIIKAAHPELNHDTWFHRPGTRQLSDGSWLIQTSGPGGFADGWIAYLTAAGFERLKTWEGVKLVEEDKEVRATDKQPA